MSEDADTRPRCTACRNLRGSWCQAAKAALLAHRDGRAEIGPTLANMPQRCPAFLARATA